MEYSKRIKKIKFFADLYYRGALRERGNLRLGGEDAFRLAYASAILLEDFELRKNIEGKIGRERSNRNLVLNMQYIRSLVAED